MINTEPPTGSNKTTQKKSFSSFKVKVFDKEYYNFDPQDEMDSEFV
jgi:hypothetical protein